MKMNYLVVSTLAVFFVTEAIADLHGDATALRSALKQPYSSESRFQKDIFHLLDESTETIKINGKWYELQNLKGDLFCPSYAFKFGLENDEESEFKIYDNEKKIIVIFSSKRCAQIRFELAPFKSKIENHLNIKTDASALKSAITKRHSEKSDLQNDIGMLLEGKTKRITILGTEYEIEKLNGNLRGAFATFLYGRTYATEYHDGSYGVGSSGFSIYTEKNAIFVRWDEGSGIGCEGDTTTIKLVPVRPKPIRFRPRDI
jgi:hypothetical protein